MLLTDPCTGFSLLSCFCIVRSTSSSCRTSLITNFGVMITRYICLVGQDAGAACFGAAKATAWLQPLTQGLYHAELHKDREAEWHQE